MYQRTEREFRDQLVRRWRDADGAWTGLARWVYTDGNSFDLTVGGTADDATYGADLVLASGATLPLCTFDREAGENNATIATELQASAAELLAVVGGGGSPSTVLSSFIRSVSRSGTTLSFIAQPAPPQRFRIVPTVSGGTGELALSPDDLFPISIDSLGFFPQTGPKTRFHVTVIPVDASGVPLDPQSRTISITARRMIDRSLQPGENRAVGVGSSVTQTLLPVGGTWVIEANGGRWCFDVSTLSGAITNLYELELWVREVTA